MFLEEKLKTMVGVAVHNEEKNIGNLLSILLDEKGVDTIIIVSSSTDNTNEIVEGYSKGIESKLRLIIESQRSGKSSAFNILIEECHKGGYDIFIYTGGDTFPSKGSIQLLLDEFRDKKIGAVGGKPEPIDNPQNFLGWTTHLQWNMLHTISSRIQPKISGDLMAFRPSIIKEIPMAIINDDAYLQLIAEAKGYQVRYCSSAIVKFRGCSSIKDLIVQRRRIYLGYMQLLFLTGIKLPTFKWRYYHKVLKDSLPSFGVKQLFYLIFAVILQFWAWSLALKDFFLSLFAGIPYKWRMAETTKELINNNQVNQ